MLRERCVLPQSIGEETAFFSRTDRILREMMATLEQLNDRIDAVKNNREEE